jgi:hypothetical protein
LDFVRKVSWRLITLILAGAAILALSPASFLSFASSEESQTALAWAVFIGVVIGFLFRKLRWFHHIDTWIHEFGHAAMVSAFGGLPKYIKLNQDSSGVTSFRHSKITPFRDIIISAAGPLASVMALHIGAVLASRGLAVPMLQVVAFVVLLVLISTVRSSFGWMVGILIWITMGVAVGLGGYLLLGLNFPPAPEVYLGAVLGLSSGVALRASFSRIRFHSIHGDEGKIAYHLRLPEVIVDWALALFNLAVVWLILDFLNIVPKINDFVNSTPEIRQKLDELLVWFQQIPIFN